jgi:hypothetical protein
MPYDTRGVFGTFLVGLLGCGYPSEQHGISAQVNNYSYKPLLPTPLSEYNITRLTDPKTYCAILGSEWLMVKPSGRGLPSLLV